MAKKNRPTPEALPFSTAHGPGTKKIIFSFILILLVVLGLGFYFEKLRPPPFPATLNEGTVHLLKTGVLLYQNSDLQFIALTPPSWTHSLKPDLRSLANIQFQSLKPEMAVVMNITDLRGLNIHKLDRFLQLTYDNLKTRQIENIAYQGTVHLPQGITTEHLKFMVDPAKVGFPMMAGYFQGESYLFLERGVGFTVIFIYPFMMASATPGHSDPVNRAIHQFLNSLYFLFPADFEKFIRERCAPLFTTIATPTQTLKALVPGEGLGSLTWELDPLK